MSTNSERIAANNTRLSALVETAESLPDAGSGGGEEPTVLTGTFTPTADVKTWTIEHNLGVVPKAILISVESAQLHVSTTKSSAGANYAGFISAVYMYGQSYASYLSTWNSRHYVNNISATGIDITDDATNTCLIHNVTETSMVLTCVNNFLYSGVTYKWVVVG